MGKFCGSFGSRMCPLYNFYDHGGVQDFVGFALTSIAPKMAHLVKQPFIILRMKTAWHLLLDP